MLGAVVGSFRKRALSRGPSPLRHMALVLCGSGYFDDVEAATGIHSFYLDFKPLIGDGPELTPLPFTKQGGHFPLWIAADAAKKFVYATDAADAEQAGYVHAYALDQEKGTLTKLNRQSTGGSSPCHLSVVGRTVLVANYSGGSVAALPILDDGSLGEAVVTEHPAGIADKVATHKFGRQLPAVKAVPHKSGRQAAAHPHIIEPGPGGTHAFVCDLGKNSVLTYELDAAASTLRLVGECTLHDGAGPRHLAFSPLASSSGLKFAYVINELDNTVTALAFDGSTLKPAAGTEPVSALAPGTPNAAGGGASELVISPDGRFAYVTVRSCGEENASAPAVFNTISTFSLDPESGAAELSGVLPSGGNMPWSCALAGPESQYLLVQNQHARHKDLGLEPALNGEGAGVIAVFHRNVDTGALTATGVQAEVPSAMSITVVPL